MAKGLSPKEMQELAKLVKSSRREEELKDDVEEIIIDRPEKEGN